MIHPDDLALDLPAAGEEAEVTARDGARLAATVAGSGPAVVLPHCWTGSRAVWAPVARRLVHAGHRVVLYDQRGHGASERGSERLTVDLLGDDLRAVLEQLDVRDAVLAGHSMGGMTVMSCAVRHPEVVAERASGVVLAATGAFGLARQGREQLWRLALAGAALDRLISRPRLGTALVRSTFGRAAAREHVEATRRLFCAIAGEVRRDCMVAMAAMDLRHGLARVEAPAAVLVGTRDTLTPRPFARAIVEHLPSARLEILPGAGHMLPFERPVELARTIRRLALGAAATTGRVATGPAATGRADVH